MHRTGTAETTLWTTDLTTAAAVDTAGKVRAVAMAEALTATSALPAKVVEMDRVTAVAGAAVAPGRWN